MQPFLDALLKPNVGDLGQKDARDLIGSIRRESIVKLCDELQKIFEREPMVMRIRSPVKIFGNLNG